MSVSFGDKKKGESYSYKAALRGKKVLSPIWELNCKLSPGLHISNSFVPSLIEIGPVVLEKKILKLISSMYFR